LADSARRISDARKNSGDYGRSPLGMSSPAYTVSPAGAASPTGPAPLSYTKINVGMGLLKFELLEDHGLRPTDSLVHFTISGLATQLGLVSDGGMTLELGIASIILQDTSKIGATLNDRRILTPYRELLSLAARKRKLGETRLVTVAGGETPPLFVKLQKPGSTASKETPMVIEVDIRDFRFTMGAVILQIPQFFVMPADTKPVEPSADDQALVRQGAPLGGIAEEDVLEEERALKPVAVVPPKPEEKAAPASPITITVRMREPYIQLVTDPTKPQCSAVTLTWALDTKIVIDGPQINVKADLKDISVLHSELDATVETIPLVIKTNSASPIIAPFALGAKFHQYPSRVLKGQNAILVSYNTKAISSLISDAHTHTHVSLYCIV
jgi:hypothetical protein